MSHYCCKSCGQRYDVCKCPPVPPHIAMEDRMPELARLRQRCEQFDRLREIRRVPALRDMAPADLDQFILARQSMDFSKMSEDIRAEFVEANQQVIDFALMAQQAAKVAADDELVAVQLYKQYKKQRKLIKKLLKTLPQDVTEDDH